MQQNKETIWSAGLDDLHFLYKNNQNDGFSLQSCISKKDVVDRVKTLVLYQMRIYKYLFGDAK